MNETINKVDWTTLYSYGTNQKNFTFDLPSPVSLANSSLAWEASVYFRPGYSDRFGVKRNLIFVDGVPSPNDLALYEFLYMAEPMPGPKGVDAEEDKIWKKFNRREIKLFNLFLDQFFNQATDEIQTFLTQAGWYNRRFDHYAGCSMCKCSRGFVMKDEMNEIKNVAVYVGFREKK